MRRILAVLAFLTVIPLAHAEQSVPTVDDDIAILRALHADRCADSNALPRIITDRPIEFTIDARTRRPFKAFGIELMSNRPRGTFWPMVELCPAVRVVNHLRLERHVDREGQLPKDYAGFEREFGATSYEKLSFPAYSVDGMSAVVVSEYVCGTCGRGGSYLFVKTANGWKLTDSQIDWMS